MPISDTSDPSLRPRTGRDFMVFDKASGNGIKVDRGTPTFGFEYWRGVVTQLNVWPAKPTFGHSQGPVKPLPLAG